MIENYSTLVNTIQIEDKQGNFVNLYLLKDSSRRFKIAVYFNEELIAQTPSIGGSGRAFDIWSKITGKFKVK